MSAAQTQKETQRRLGFLELDEARERDASLAAKGAAIVGVLQDATIPPTARDLAVLDIVHSGPGDPSSREVPFLDAWRRVQDKKVIGVCGGARLEAEGERNSMVFLHINEPLAKALAAGGWSVVSGGGPGKAMKGLQACHQQALHPSDAALSISIKAGLCDEQLHPHTDIIVRQQREISIREKMIIGLSSVVLFYPGHIGTLAELSDTLLQNYVENRGLPSTNPPLIILVSYRGAKFCNGHFWGGIEAQLGNAEKAKLSKGGDMPYLKTVVLPSPEEFQNYTSEERRNVVGNHAAQIFRLAEAHYRKVHPRAQPAVNNDALFPSVQGGAGI
jgi:predicted Rossmann-fold nucleotide-binding protein